MSQNRCRINGRTAASGRKRMTTPAGAPAPALPALLAQAPRDRPVLIAGPTASGKSALALALARAQGRVVVNADALQVYARWRILTARPTAEDEAAAPHLLYGHVGARESWSVGHWLRAVAEIIALHPGAVIVGGTGLYFTALTEGLVEIPPIPPEIRAASIRRLAEAGAEGLLADLDAATAARIDRRNPARLQRAWEVLAATGRGLALWQAATPPPILPPGRATACVIERPPADLARRIDARVAAMAAEGALEEAARALPDWDPTLPSSRAIGAAEFVAHVRGATTLESAIAAAQGATRAYAKRQRTWARNRLGDWPRLVLGGAVEGGRGADAGGRAGRKVAKTTPSVETRH
jgi:tRNA dimethylallyltransferase